jgi:hypothetical protein
MDKQQFTHNLHLILEPYAALQHLDCDGLTRVFHNVLSDKEVRHTVYCGEVIYGDGDNAKIIPIHFWIDIEDITIDYRARTWLGEKADIPHGVFHSVNYPKISYRGDSVNLSLMSDLLFQILIEPFPIIVKNEFRKASTTNR